MPKADRLVTKFEVVRDTPVLHVDGTLDANSSANFRHDVEELFASGYKNLLLDFTNLNFMDSSGIGALIYVYRSLHDQGGKELWVAGCNPQVRSLLEVTQLDKQLKCYESPAKAVDAWYSARIK